MRYVAPDSVAPLTALELGRGSGPTAAKPPSTTVPLGTRWIAGCPLPLTPGQVLAAFWINCAIRSLVSPVWTERCGGVAFFQACLATAALRGAGSGFWARLWDDVGVRLLVLCLSDQFVDLSSGHTALPVLDGALVLLAQTVSRPEPLARGTSDTAAPPSQTRPTAVYLVGHCLAALQALSGSPHRHRHHQQYTLLCALNALLPAAGAALPATALNLVLKLLVQRLPTLAQAESEAAGPESALDDVHSGAARALVTVLPLLFENLRMGLVRDPAGLLARVGRRLWAGLQAYVSVVDAPVAGVFCRALTHFSRAVFAYAQPGLLAQVARAGRTSTADLVRALVRHLSPSTHRALAELLRTVWAHRVWLGGHPLDALLALYAWLLQPAARHVRQARDGAWHAFLALLLAQPTAYAATFHGPLSPRLFSTLTENATAFEFHGDLCPSDWIPSCFVTTGH